MNSVHRASRALISCFAAAALVVLPGAALARAGGVTAFVGGTVIDGTGAAPLAGGVVVVEGARIAAVGPPGAVAVPAGAALVDTRGKWVIPGLIDAHVHFFQSGGLYTRPDIIDLRNIRPYAEELAWIRRRLPLTFARYLASGVTGVVDVGGPFSNFEVRDLARRTRLAPRVAVAGPLLATYAPEALDRDDPAIIRVTSAAQARALVRREAGQKPDLIKLWLIMGRGARLADEMGWVRAAIAEAHTAGIRVAAHATRREVARAAVLAGVDVLAHSVDDREVDAAFAALLKERGVVYTTTLVVGENYYEVLAQRIDLNETERRLGDSQVIATFGDLATLPPRMVPGWLRTLRPPSHETAFANLRRLHAAGVMIAAGSDAGNIGTLHGPGLHRELELMAEAGLEPMAVLIAATRGGARAMGREADLGTIEAGKLADLVILDADPLADIANTGRIHRVVKGGEVLVPEEILARALEGK